MKLSLNNLFYVFLEFFAIAGVPFFATACLADWVRIWPVSLLSVSLMFYGMLIYERKWFKTISWFARGAGVFLGFVISCTFVLGGYTDSSVFLRLSTLGLALYYFEIAKDLPDEQLRKFGMAVVLGVSMLAQARLTLGAAFASSLLVFLSFLVSDFCKETKPFRTE